jgi:hypothetical protein
MAHEFRIFASCEQDNGLENKEVSGKDVAVRIRSMSVAEGGSESLGRSSLEKEPEIVSQPIGDGMLLEMSIKEDEPPLRDKQELTTGAYFRIIAVKAGTTEYHSHGDFVYGGANSLPEFHVKIGDYYDYICFSYNETTNTLPSTTGYIAGVALPTLLTIDPTDEDPLWCKIEGDGPVDAAGVELEITLKRLLAKVKVKVDCSYNDWKITDVTTDQIAVVVNDPDDDCTIDWKTGILSGANLDQGLTYIIDDATRTDQTSNEVTIIPKGSNAIIKIKANAVSRDNLAAIPSAEWPATLPKALTGGVSYTITVRLRTPMWASSNIYWVPTGTYDDDEDGILDGATGRLTFDPYQADGRTAPNKGYQGVFFKWGSLVGISPAPTEVPGSPGTMTINFLPTTPVYIPTCNTSVLALSTWKSPITSDYTASGWAYASSTNTDDPTIIPHMDGRAAFQPAVYGRNDQYVIDHNDPTEMWAKGRGDICQYLGATAEDTDEGRKLKGYRLPTSNEFGLSNTSFDWSLSRSPDGWERGGNNSSATGNASGTHNMIGTCLHIKNVPMGNVTLPGSGYRSGGTGALTGVGTNGNYWSGSANSYSTSHYLDFYASTLYTYDSHNRAYGFSVRCVKN